MKYFDQHLHTEFSFDSKENVENYIAAAIERGAEYLVTTEHLEYDWKGDGSAEGKDLIPDFAAQKRLYERLSEKYPSITLMQGVEIGYQRKCRAEIKKVLAENDFDLINMSVHDYKGTDLYFYDFEHDDPNEVLEYNFGRIVEAAASDIDYDVICHVDYAFRAAYEKNKNLKIDLYADFLKKIFRIVIDRDKALEINTKVQQRIGDEAHTRKLLSLYKESGGRALTLSDDAHRISNFMAEPEKYAAIIKECGFDTLRFYIRRKPYDVKIEELFR